MAANTAKNRSIGATNTVSQSVNCKACLQWTVCSLPNVGFNLSDCSGCYPVGPIFRNVKAFRNISNMSCKDDVIITNRTNILSPGKKTQVVLYHSFFFKTTLTIAELWATTWPNLAKHNSSTVYKTAWDYGTMWLSKCVLLSLMYLISKASSTSTGAQVCLLQLCSSLRMQMDRLHCSHFSLMSFVP